mmetsp:Transcript_18627/g.56239  ORF Transcript_18627/g.56239 Transcript_18627/m.56239 type:complete len:268 (+) Transcript_18627:3823-4626(+)
MPLGGSGWGAGGGRWKPASSLSSMGYTGPGGRFATGLSSDCLSALLFCGGGRPTSLQRAASFSNAFCSRSAARAAFLMACCSAFSTRASTTRSRRNMTPCTSRSRAVGSPCFLRFLRAEPFSSPGSTKVPVAWGSSSGGMGRPALEGDLAAAAGAPVVSHPSRVPFLPVFLGCCAALSSARLRFSCVRASSPLLFSTLLAPRSALRWWRVASALRRSISACQPPRRRITKSYFCNLSTPGSPSMACSTVVSAKPKRSAPQTPSKLSA